MGDISEGLPESGGLPPYIQEGTKWVEAWTDEFKGWSLFTERGFCLWVVTMVFALSTKKSTFLEDALTTITLDN